MLLLVSSICDRSFNIGLTAPAKGFSFTHAAVSPCLDFEPRFEPGPLDPPLPAATELHGRQVAMTNKRVDLRAAGVEQPTGRARSFGASLAETPLSRRCALNMLSRRGRGC
jgi:hypothetical protein